MTTEDLWGKLPDVETLRTPLVILKEQGELLTKKTDGLLVGRVNQPATNVGFQYNFIIAVPTLNNYQFNLLTISHDIGFYPVRLINHRGKNVNCPDEGQFKEELRKIFTSEETQSIISKLLTHVRSQE